MCRRKQCMRSHDVWNVWARVGDVEIHATVALTLLDSLAEDLSHDNERELIPGDAVTSIGVVSFLRMTNAVLSIQSLVGERWRTSSTTKFLIGACCHAPLSLMQSPVLMVLIVTKWPTTWNLRGDPRRNGCS